MKKKTRRYKTHMRFFRKAFTKKSQLTKGLVRAAAESFIDWELLELFTPTADDYVQLVKEGKGFAYWDSGYKTRRLGQFTKLRQTIVLLMAAIKGEL